jgi:hypothetical protein
LGCHQGYHHIKHIFSSKTKKYYTLYSEFYIQNDIVYVQPMIRDDFGWESKDKYKKAYPYAKLI